MGIKHSITKIAGEKLFAVADWNQDHVVDSSINISPHDFTTTGKGSFGNLDVDTLNFNANIISDSTGTISFDNDNLTTQGDITGDKIFNNANQGEPGAIVFIGSANGELQADDEALKWDNNNFKLIRGTLEIEAGSITDTTGAISFGDENLTTTGDISCKDVIVSGSVDGIDIAGMSAFVILNSGHRLDNSQAHSDYMLNTGDTSTGDYDFTAGNLTTTGHVAIGGVVDLRYLLHLPYTKSVGALDASRAFNVNMDITATANNTKQHAGFMVDVDLQGTKNYTATAGYGGLVGAQFTTRGSGSGTIAEATGFAVYHSQTAGTLTSYTGIAIANPGHAGIITNVTGIWLAGFSAGTNNSGIVIDGDNAGGDIIFGAGQDSSIYYDGNDLVLDPQLVGSGTIDIKIAPTTGLASNSLVPFSCTAYFTIELNGVAYKIPCEAV